MSDRDYIESLMVGVPGRMSKVSRKVYGQADQMRSAVVILAAKRPRRACAPASSYVE
jgi:hypothetical protein